MVGRVLPTAMCVRGIDDLCVLQFTLVNAAGCALHRRTSRVIHRIELSFLFRKLKGATSRPLSRRSGDLRRCQQGATLEGPTRRRDNSMKPRGGQGLEQGGEEDVHPPHLNDRDDVSCEGDHPRVLTPRSDPKTLPEGRVSGPAQDAQLRTRPHLTSRTIAMS